MTTPMQRNARPIQHGAPTRLFDIGQAVRLKGGPGVGPKTGEIYHVNRTLPPRGNSPQYRIRSDAEPHERMVTEDRLEPVDEVSDGGIMLIERTFGHGQGTEAPEPRDQEAEAGKDSGQV
ncbi:hypothetical protein [Mesorhizobium sp.]|uniref:hypothetical protein n=1 Tax=Mesorhizobium sp. TaxID=1871066 RepID=UPI000FE34D8E|nr:hypothetical protein [Mesorhizobium sp.]RWA69260.1 MAG: hypothetical protein EOQ28_23665 [Mesorhizobium sp.]RWB98151.1 MAG: hypothetical protein EOQ57_22615 [Mesorhizobium sp.]RWG85135.1 MAG: hypothetical protein EOQ69_08730 [Mesorhizobium sp.]RWG88917.1 MAG: hypothetical protein EOQ70_09600 [Mesorhizobium sp.]RWK02217.1 MAG: hypothetical protein EOR42_20080 [Mesorhizobium sp.]